MVRIRQPPDDSDNHAVKRARAESPAGAEGEPEHEDQDSGGGRSKSVSREAEDGESVPGSDTVPATAVAGEVSDNADEEGPPDDVFDDLWHRRVRPEDLWGPPRPTQATGLCGQQCQVGGQQWQVGLVLMPLPAPEMPESGMADRPPSPIPGQPSMQPPPETHCRVEQRQPPSVCERGQMMLMLHQSLCDQCSRLPGVWDATTRRDSANDWTWRSAGWHGWHERRDGCYGSRQGW